MSDNLVEVEAYFLTSLRPDYKALKQELSESKKLIQKELQSKLRLNPTNPSCALLITNHNYNPKT